MVICFLLYSKTGSGWESEEKEEGLWEDQEKGKKREKRDGREEDRRRREGK